MNNGLAQAVCPRGKPSGIFLVSGLMEARIMNPDGTEDIVFEDDVCERSKIRAINHAGLLKPDEVLQEGWAHVLLS